MIGFGPAEGFTPDLRVGGGWTLDLEGDVSTLTLEAVHTPGHASDHLCWLIRQSRTLLTGDHLMHGSTVVIRPPDAIQLSCAAAVGVELFITNDASLQKITVPGIHFITSLDRVPI